MTYAREGPGPLHLPADARTFEDFLKERRLHSLVSMEIASPMTHPCQLPPADVPAAELTEWLDWQGRCTPRRTCAHSISASVHAQCAHAHVRNRSSAAGQSVERNEPLERVSLTRLVSQVKARRTSSSSGGRWTGWARSSAHAHRSTGPTITGAIT